MHRTLTTIHPATTDIEYRVSMHQPMKADEVGSTTAIVPDGEPWAVVEIFHRQPNGDWKLIGSMREQAFDETVDEIRSLTTFLKKQTDASRKREVMGDEEPESEPFKLVRRADAPEIPPTRRRVLVAEEP